jgi:hypothetical protein
MLRGFRSAFINQKSHEGLLGEVKRKSQSFGVESSPNANRATVQELPGGYYEAWHERFIW